MEVTGGGAGYLIAVIVSELAGKAQEFRPKKITSPVSGEGVPTPTPTMSRAAVTTAIYCINSTVFGDICCVWERPDTWDGC